jgi:hypothetical protein
MQQITLLTFSLLIWPKDTRPKRYQPTHLKDYAEAVETYLKTVVFANNNDKQTIILKILQLTAANLCDNERQHRWEERGFICLFIKSFPMTDPQARKFWRELSLLLWRKSATDGYIYSSYPLRTAYEHKTPWLLVRKRTIPTGRQPLVSEIRTNFCG